MIAVLARLRKVELEIVNLRGRCVSLEAENKLTRTEVLSKKLDEAGAGVPSNCAVLLCPSCCEYTKTVKKMDEYGFEWVWLDEETSLRVIDHTVFQNPAGWRKSYAYKEMKSHMKSCVPDQYKLKEFSFFSHGEVDDFKRCKKEFPNADGEYWLFTRVEWFAYAQPEREIGNDYVLDMLEAALGVEEIDEEEAMEMDVNTRMASLTLEKKAETMEKAKKWEEAFRALGHNYPCAVNNTILRGNREDWLEDRLAKCTKEWHNKIED